LQKTFFAVPPFYLQIQKAFFKNKLNNTEWYRILLYYGASL